MEPHTEQKLRLHQSIGVISAQEFVTNRDWDLVGTISCLAMLDRGASPEELDAFADRIENATPLEAAEARQQLKEAVEEKKLAELERRGEG